MCERTEARDEGSAQVLRYSLSPGLKTVPTIEIQLKMTARLHPASPTKNMTVSARTIQTDKVKSISA